MRFPKTQIVTFANQKGGCGKTTGSVSIAAAFAELGYSVCLVDTDPQCNATEHLGVTQDMLRREGLPSLADIYLAKRDAIDVELDFGDRFKKNGGNLCLIPGHTGLSAVEARLSSEILARVAENDHSMLEEDDMRDEHRYRLKKSLDTLRGQHDLVILDTPPELGFLMTTALIAADWYMIPVFPSAFDLKGLEKLSQTVEKIKARYNGELVLGGVILGNFDKSTKLDSQVHDMLKTMFGERLVFKTVIGRGVRNREATFSGLTIFEHAPGDPASEQYIRIVKEMLTKRQSQSPTRLPKVTDRPVLPSAGSSSQSDSTQEEQNLQKQSDSQNESLQREEGSLTKVDSNQSEGYASTQSDGTEEVPYSVMSSQKEAVSFAKEESHQEEVASSEARLYQSQRVTTGNSSAQSSVISTQKEELNQHQVDSMIESQRVSSAEMTAPEKTQPQGLAAQVEKTQTTPSIPSSAELENEIRAENKTVNFPKVESKRLFEEYMYEDLDEEDETNGGGVANG